MASCFATIQNSILAGKRNIVFLGGTGSGKTEFALNLACDLAGCQPLPVHLFDMDQTKPLFRSRSACDALEEHGVTLHFNEQLLDAPTLVAGVRAALCDPGRIALLDVGGGEMGSRMVGGLSQLLNNDHTLVFYLVNPYRPWTASENGLLITMAEVLGGSRIQNAVFWANPTLGADTSSEECIAGLRQAQQLLPAGAKLSGACVHDTLMDAVQAHTALPLYPMRRFITEPWEV